MLYKLLKVEGERLQNIGDYIQALAASQFYPQINGYIDREELNLYVGDDSVVIMNGWFMHNPTNWPPSSKILPLFVAFHLNVSSKDTMLTNNGVEYLKRYEPIGCRDNFTKNILLSKGIKAYFSGCLTLTLGNKYLSLEKRCGIYFVDPLIPNSRDIISIGKDTLYILFNPIRIHKISYKLKASKNKLANLYKTSRFYRLYRKIFDESDLVEAEYIKHQTVEYLVGFKNETERLQEAERLIGLYSRAIYVVTSRIHCALPCLSLKTPVYFTYWETDEFISSCRYGGLIELFNTVKCGKKSLVREFDFDGMIAHDHTKPNKDDWQPLSHALTKKCKDFVTNMSKIEIDN